MVFFQDFVSRLILLLALFSIVHAHEDHDSAIHESAHNKEHIKEHLKDEAEVNVDEMSDEEFHFYYFTLHDYDQNKKLDGLEILYGMNDHDHHSNTTDEHPGYLTEEEGAEMVDKVLRRMDQNSDGYIDYPEYTKALEQLHEHGNPQ